MRLRVLVGGRMVRDLKVPKHDRVKLSEGMAVLERKCERLGLEPMSVSIAGVDGLLESITRKTENGEEIIVVEFWENS